MCCAVAALAGLLELIINTFDEPGSLPDGYVVDLHIGEPHVVHQQEDMLEVVALISRCQAKKTRLPTGAAPPSVPGRMGSPSRTSSRCQVHSYR